MVVKDLNPVIGIDGDVKEGTKENELKDLLVQIQEDVVIDDS